MATITTELPISPAGLKSKSGSDALEAEAIGLDVSVRIHGSQVAAVVLESTEHVEPFEEDTSTMIVFPRGAVVKLRARVRNGHAIVLTNLATKQTALCRIIQVNTAPNIAHYVKLEFIQPTPGFWGVHFPSDPLPSARPQEIPAPVSAHATPAAVPDRFAELAAQMKPAQPPQIASRPAVPAAPVLHAAPSAETQPVAVKPQAPGVMKSTLPPELPLSIPSPGYGSARHGQEENIVSLASSSFSAERTAANQTKFVPPSPKAKSKRERRAATVEPPIFDALTTQEEVFPREEPATHGDSEGYANAGASRKAISGVDYSSLLQPASPAKQRSSTLLFAAAAVVVLAFVAAGAMYVRRNLGYATRTASEVPASVSSQPASQPAAVTPSPVETSSVLTPSSTSEQPPHSAAIAKPSPATPENPITAEPVRDTQKGSASTSHPIISTGTADIYAGDLRARPQITRRAAAHVTAPMPNVTAPASMDIPASAGGNALGSLVSGGARSSLVAPAPPKPALAQGGNVQLPRLISSVAPVYPQLATANHVEGDVKIQAQISASGRVTSTKVISGPILLRGAAIDAVRKWKYSPAILDGKPIATQYAVTVRFHLNQ
ncbi:MAG TPA: TonB family protein [Candidatus Acidoferrales bacterium]|nr:TonB family protein [Candidatus Acidoferrales bacterium]